MTLTRGAPPDVGARRVLDVIAYEALETAERPLARMTAAILFFDRAGNVVGWHATISRQGKPSEGRTHVWGDAETLQAFTERLSGRAERDWLERMARARAGSQQEWLLRDGTWGLGRWGTV